MTNPENFQISNPLDLNLHVEKRIGEEDAKRQTKTAQEIIKRFEQQPGLILADEVGMGKTFVGLAAAAAAHFNDPERNPVVVMVPPALAHKWPRDAEVFRNQCLQSPWREQFKFNEQPIESGIDFLKTLDDDGVIRQRYAVVFVTHGALYRSMSDNWVKLAILRRALFGKHNVDDVRRALAHFVGKLLRMQRSVPDDAWEGLLDRDPEDWLSYLKRHFPDSVPEVGDDPVPAHLWVAIKQPDQRPALDEIRELLDQIPRRESKYLDENLTALRQLLKEKINEIWKSVKGRLNLRLPLLIFDEAHHLKNQSTQLVKSLFKSGQEASEGVNGAFYGVFSKMLFLTATPFQLGHYELLSVLRHFQCVAWDKQAENAMTPEKYTLALDSLSKALDRAQEGALRLDSAWGRLSKEDMTIAGDPVFDEEVWWKGATAGKALTLQGIAAHDQAANTEKIMREAEKLLRPWVLRHLKPREMKFETETIPRREIKPGKGILDSPLTREGLDVGKNSMVPFLLAARTVSITPNGRAVYAEGLASSYEAFLNTHKNRSVGQDLDEDFVSLEDDPETNWYAKAIHKALTKDDKNPVPSDHPKVSATAQKVIRLWELGEKVLVFCHYIETGRALRLAISKAMQNRLIDLAAPKMPGSSREDIENRLESYGDKFFDSDGETRLYFDEVVGSIIDQYSVLAPVRAQLIDILRRFVRTPAYLARFFSLRNELGPKEIDDAFKTTDSSGLSLREVFEGFLEFLGDRCQERERKEYLEAVDRIQTGSHLVASSARLAGEDFAENSEITLPNVRLANGTTAQDARRKLMLAFNTPFYPEVLIASSVLAEGVDLHLNCRYVIHHDLCWNPSTLEQRNGRVDRIGSKSEKSHQPIEIYLPYIGGTQDEKMYRVVMDRERWFKVVMGEEMKTDTATVERISERIPLPLSLAEKLAFRLEVDFS